MKSQTGFVKLNKEYCVACWNCVNVCPQNIFKKINIIIHKHARIKNGHRCTGCRKCVEACISRAISIIGK